MDHGAAVGAFLALFAKTFGFAFYQDINAVYWAGYGGTSAAASRSCPTRTCSSAGWCNNQVFQVILILLIILWFFAWVGTCSCRPPG